MAEGLLRNATDGKVAVFSAGTTPGTVRPEASAVMAERGIDISGHRSKPVDELDDIRFDYVITVCDNANANFRYFRMRPGGFIGAPPIRPQSRAMTNSVSRHFAV